MNQMEQFAAIVAERRKAKKMTQKMLADRLGISPQAVSKWENGLGFPDMIMLPALSETLEISLDELFGVKPLPRAEAPILEAPGLESMESGDEASVPASRKRGLFGWLIGTEEERKLEESRYAEVDSLWLSLARGCRVKVIKTDEPQCKVSICATKDFLNATTVTCENRLLKIKVAEKKRVCKHYERNTVTVYVPFEQGRLLHVSIYGSSSVEVLPSFDVGEVCITGSGDLVAGSFFQRLSATVSGSGDFIVDDSLGETTLRISGSGDMRFGRLVNANVKVSGSGDLDSDQTRGNTHVTVRGSGDVELGDLLGELDVRISGSGDVSGRGELEQLFLELLGSGDFHGDRLAVTNAELHASGSGNISIGCVRGDLTKNIGRSTTLVIGARK
ncbi:MAG: DUF2807 domain-containing protein [Clostridia bacterium]|nr:DUF2807 domain-containing protein [Clostridia bacterium]